MSRGTIDNLLKHVGTTDLASERLNIVVNIGASWLAQVLSTLPGMPSGPAAFLVFTFSRVPPDMFN